MARDILIRQLKPQPDVRDLERLIVAAKNPREKAFVSTLGKTGISISESIQLKVTDIDFDRGTLTIMHLNHQLKLKCHNCGEIL